MSYSLLCGDALTVLKTLPAESVQTVITSPPYYGLRSYIDDADPDKPLEIGLEESPECYVAKLVEVFREVRRVLRADATCWINLGDSWQDKQLLGIPWRVAFALQADGWILRSEVIWHKRAPMPESVTDRPTKAHEQLFLLAKSQSYYYDADAIREPQSASSHGGNPLKSRINGLAEKRSSLQNIGSSTLGAVAGEDGRNRRSVWSLGPESFSGAHFATMPTKLVEPCILAGTSAKGACSAPVKKLKIKENLSAEQRDRLERWLKRRGLL